MTDQRNLMIICNMISDFWPDFHITPENLKHPTAEFVQAFYTKFMADYNEKFSYVTNVSAFDDWGQKTEYDSTVYLYCEVAKIYKKLSCPISLNDFYFPQAKRISSMLKLGIHFLIYLNNNLDELASPLNDLLKKQADVQHLISQKQELLESVNENAEKLAVSEVTLSELKPMLAAVEDKRQNTLAGKIQREKLLADMESEKGSLAMYCNDADDKLLRLEKELRGLQQRIITPEECEYLEKEANRLKLDLEKLSTDDDGMAAGMTDEKNVVEHLQTCSKNMQDLTLVDVGNVAQKCKKLKSEVESLLVAQNEIREKIRSLNALKDDEAQKLEMLKSKKEANLKRFSEIKTKLDTRFQETNKEFTKELGQAAALFKEEQELRTEISRKKDGITNLEDERNMFKSKAIVQYKRILDAHREATERLYHRG